MFTGITQQVVSVTDVQSSNGLITVTVELPEEQYVLGDSIMMNGICSTVTQLTDTTLTVEFMQETIDLTTVSAWQVGSHINIESPATLQSKLSGSLVTGHVDTVGTVRAIENGSDYGVTIEYPVEYARYVLQKGSITFNGVNLTVVDPAVAGDAGIGYCSVKLIPYTKEHTTMGGLKTGDSVNVEFDYISKIVQHGHSVEEALSSAVSSD